MLTQSTDKTIVACSLTRMHRDFKRILRVQFKEFLHYLDEAPADAYLSKAILKERSNRQVINVRSPSRAA